MEHLLPFLDGWLLLERTGYGAFTMYGGYGLKNYIKGFLRKIKVGG